MREILFRGKRIDNGEWVEGLYTENCISHASGCAIIEDYFEKYDVKRDTVGQYIGLNDRNGNRIFEGDLLQRYSDYFGRLIGTPCLVKYDEFNCSCCDGIYGWMFRGGDIRSYKEYEIVGNIHDNPELIAEVEG